MSLSEDLSRLSELYEGGGISFEEFTAAKQQLLAQQVVAEPAGAPAPASHPAAEASGNGIGEPLFPNAFSSPSNVPTAAAPSRAAGVAEWLKGWATTTDWKRSALVSGRAVAGGVAALVVWLVVAVALIGSGQDDGILPTASDAGVEIGANTFTLWVKGLLLVVAMAFRAPAKLSVSVPGVGEMFGGGTMTASLVLPLTGVAVALLGALYLSVRLSHKSGPTETWRTWPGAAAAYAVPYAGFVGVLAALARIKAPVGDGLEVAQVGLAAGVVAPVLWALVFAWITALVALRPWRGDPAVWRNVDSRFTGVAGGLMAIGAHLLITAVGATLYGLFQVATSSGLDDLTVTGRLGLALGALLFAPLAAAYGGMFGLGGTFQGGMDAPAMGDVFAQSGSIGLFGQEALPLALQLATIVAALAGAYAGGLWLRRRTSEAMDTAAVVTATGTFAAAWLAILVVTSAKLSASGDLLEGFASAGSFAPQVSFSPGGVLLGAVLVAALMGWVAQRTGSTVLPMLERLPLWSRPAVAEVPGWVPSTPAALFEDTADAVLPVPTPPDLSEFADDPPAQDPPASRRLPRRPLLALGVAIVVLALAGGGVVIARQMSAATQLQQQLAETQEELSGVRADLADARTELADVQAELDDAEQATASVRDDLADARSQLSDAEDRAAAAEGRAEIAEELLASSASLSSSYPSDYGSDSYLDGLTEDCAAGDYGACEDLYLESDVGSSYEDFGATCGGEYSTWMCD